ncbi:ATP-binding protein [Streptomyces sp. NPDC020412]|uniref:ATP-binding protein n=1 Tax=Streptomyces sp. NPDC020412 TaxID=3365073 RepID=UPI00378A6EED
MSIWWSLHLRREAASIPLARRLLIGAMETAGVDPDISFDLSVALSEACANAVEHGGGPAPGDPSGASEAYRVTAYLDGERCRIEVADSGPGFPARSTRHGGCAHAAGLRQDGRENRDGREGRERRDEVREVRGARESREAREGREMREGRERPERQAVALAESGRGLCLIEELADHVDFSNRPGRGAVVSFDKVLKWREDALLKVS